MENNNQIIRIPNISEYNIEFIENTLILTHKIITITEEDLDKYSLTYSTILNCTINN